MPIKQERTTTVGLTNYRPWLNTLQIFYIGANKSSIGIG